MASLFASLWPWSMFLALAVFIARPLFDPLRSVPGPFIARWTDLWYMWHLVRGDFEKTNLELHQNYGPIVRYGPYRYSISESSAIRAIYGPGTQFAKSSWYSSWTNPGSWSLFADQDIKRHAKGRSLFQATYSMSALVDYEQYVDEGADVLFRRLEEIVQSGAAVDMRYWFQCYAFDIIGAITYGQRFGFLDQGEDIESLMSALDSHLFYATIAGLLPSLHSVLFALRNWWAGGKGAGRAYLLSFTMKNIDRHNNNLATSTGSLGKPLGSRVMSDEEGEDYQPRSFLSKFLHKHTEDAAKFTHNHVVASCISNIVAGSDTTAISLSATLYHLLTTPSSLEKLRKEIATAEANGLLSAKPTFKETSKMPYLQSVIKEALRVHPATGLPLERVVPSGGFELGSYFFPARRIVGINTWVGHRDKSVFGDDADHFRPERWLIDDAERLSVMNRHYMPFGLGSRVCIGRHIAMLEMTKLIPRIVRDFDFQSEDMKDPSAGKATWPTQNVWFVKPTNFRLRVKARSLPVTGLKN